MQLPFISRKEHELVCARHLEGLQAANAAHEHLCEQYRQEIKILSRRCLASSNEAAILRGQLVAERHAREEPG